MVCWWHWFLSHVYIFSSYSSHDKIIFTCTFFYCLRSFRQPNWKIAFQIPAKATKPLQRQINNVWITISLLFCTSAAWSPGSTGSVALLRVASLDFKSTSGRCQTWHQRKEWPSMTVCHAVKHHVGLYIRRRSLYSAVLALPHCRSLPCCSLHNGAGVKCQTLAVSIERHQVIWLDKQFSLEYSAVWRAKHMCHIISFMSNHMLRLRLM